MIGILTKRNFFYVREEDLVIDISYFMLGQYYGCSGNYRRPIGETIAYLGREVGLKVVDWLRRDAVSGERYSRS